MHSGGLELALVLLLAAVIAVPVFKKFGFGAVLGYLAAGVVLGPDGLGFVQDADRILGAAEIGVVMLLFVIGLELSPARLKVMRRSVFGAGAAQVALSGLVLGGLLLLDHFQWKSALVVGVAFAKGAAWAAELPIIGVNHLEGHLYANKLAAPDLQPPAVVSLVSGGNTMLVHVRDWGSYEVLGQTIDDAVGEAFDKVAKALGLGYPGGPVISRLAAKGNRKAIRFPRAMLHSGDYSFSLSGLKTSVITYINNENRAGRPITLPARAARFEAAVIDVQVAKAVEAVEQTGVSDFCVGGGVAANPQLREAYRRKFGRMGVRVTVPPFSACTDNAAMIALVARRKFLRGETAELTMDADPNMSL